MATIQNFAFTGNKITEAVTSTIRQTITRIVTDESGNSVATLESETYGNVANFRYENIIRTLFNDNTSGITGANYCYINKKIRAKAGITRNGNTSYYVFSRGVAGHAEDEKMTLWKFATTMPALKLYQGYELEVTFGFDGSEFTILKDGDRIDSARMNPDIVSIGLEGMTTGGIIGLEDEDGKTKDTITLAVLEAPENPFYVRWINNKGGIDFFMFTHNNKKSLRLTTNEYFDSGERNGMCTLLEKKAEKTIEVTTGMVDRQTLEAVASMAMSPCIEWYNEKTDEWAEIQVASADSEILASQPTGEMVLTFVLPNPQMNR